MLAHEAEAGLLQRFKKKDVVNDDVRLPKNHHRAADSRNEVANNGHPDDRYDRLKTLYSGERPLPDDRKYAGYVQ